MNATDNKLVNVFFKQKQYFDTGATRSLKFRLRQLHLLKKIISANRHDILNAVRKDLSRHDFETTFAEIEMLLHAIRYISENLKKWMQPEYVPHPPLHQPGKSFIFKEPYGVTLIIAPWNYPILLLFEPLAGAIAAGNCAMLKPSQNAVFTSELTAKLISENFDEKYISVVHGENTDRQALLSLPFDYIFYTGSTETGKLIMQSAAKNLTPVTLELGGKSPCVVDQNVSLKRTARRICFGKFFNAGQTCVAPDYVLVHESCADQLIFHLQNSIREHYGDNPALSPSYARIINLKQFDRLTGLLNYGKIAAGGVTDRELKYISPTLMTDVDLNSPLMNSEIFGPILPIITFRKTDEAIEFIKRKPKPLALYLFTRDKKNIRRFIHETSSGGLLINDTLSHLTNPYLPFGGIGASGMGKYHGRKTFDTFTHEKSVMKKSLFPDGSLRYPPYKTPNRFLRFWVRLLS